MSKHSPKPDAAATLNVCEQLSLLSKKFEFGHLNFNIKGSDVMFPLEEQYMEDLIIGIAMAEASLKGLISLDEIGVARVERLIPILNKVLDEYGPAPEGRATI